MDLSPIREKLATPKGYLLSAIPFLGSNSLIAVIVGEGILESVFLMALIIASAYLPLRWHNDHMRASKAFLAGSTIRLFAFAAAAVIAIPVNKAPLSWLIAPSLCYFCTLSIELILIIWPEKR